MRNPAHYCGVFGHKPTWGLLPGRGHSLPGVLRQPDLAVIGPLAHSAEDLEAGLQATAGPDELRRAGYRFDLQAPSRTSLAGYRVAVWKNDYIAPVMATPAFEHDHAPLEYRTIEVEGVVQPYRQQIFWAALAVCAYLPSAVVPAGLGDDDLPIGVQIIGPEYGVLKTVGLGRLLEGAGFAFTPSPGHC